MPVWTLTLRMIRSVSHKVDLRPHGPSRKTLAMTSQALRQTQKRASMCCVTEIGTEYTHQRLTEGTDKEQSGHLSCRFCHCAVVVAGSSLKKRVGRLTIWAALRSCLNGHCTLQLQNRHPVVYLAHSSTVILDKSSPCIPDWPQTHDSPASTSWEMDL